jgi:hypothetical protein
MSSVSIWSKAPKSVRLPPTIPETVTSNNIDGQRIFVVDDNSQKITNKNPAKNTFPGIIPAGQKCSHGKWQPEAAETVRAKKWTCYECSFVCSKCGLNSVGLCDSYDCS